MIKMASISLFRLFLILSTVYSLGAQVHAGSLRAWLDRNSVSVREPIVLQVSVEGTYDKAPSPDPIRGLVIRESGTSSGVTIINGRMSRSTTWSFVLIPEQTGTYTIPPIEMIIDNNQETSAAIQFTAHPPASQVADTADQIPRMFVEADL